MKCLQVLVLVCVAAGAVACKSEPKADAAGSGKPGGAGGGPRGPMAFPVEVAPIELRDVQLVLSAVGSVDAYERVQVTARIAGVIERVRFSEGEHVKAEQVLAEIEPRRYQVAVRSAKASLERVRASKAEAQAGLARREAAIAQSPGLIPAEELETWRTKLRLAEAQEMEVEAQVDEAQLNLRDAYVRAPVAGTIETRNVQTGQYAQPGAVLATLVRRDPLLVRFSVPEGDAGKLARDQQVSFRVQGGDEAFLAKITHIAALADVATRMVPVTGEVNPEQRDRLRPGSFAEVSIAIGGRGKAPIVPERAVRPSERGFIAYVVEGDVARERVVALGMHTEDGHVEVLSGLREGEQLVVRGAESLKDGAKVRVSPAAGSSPEARK